MGKRLKLLQEQLVFLIDHNASAEEIAEMEGKIKRSKVSTRSKAKGGAFESKVAKIIGKRFPELDLVKTPSSGGFQHSSNNQEIRGDISNLNKEVTFMLHIEAKNQKVIKMKDWLKQAQSDCPKGKIPSVVFHQQQEIKEGKVVVSSAEYICMGLHDFLELVDEKKVVKKNVRL